MYRSTDTQNYFESLWVLLLSLFCHVCLYGGRGTTEVPVKKKVHGDTQHGQNHGLGPQMPQEQNQTPDLQGVVRTGETPEAGNHSNQYAEQEETRKGNIPIKAEFKLSYSLRFKLFLEAQLRLRFTAGISSLGSSAQIIPFCTPTTTDPSLSLFKMSRRKNIRVSSNMAPKH